MMGGERNNGREREMKGGNGRNEKRDQTYKRACHKVHF